MISIIMYHSVSQYYFAVETESFRRQLKYLKRSNVGSLSRLEAMTKGAVVTLDDGYVDNYESTFPLLKEVGVPATIFPVTESIGGTHKFGRSQSYQCMTREMISEMARSDLVDFGSHTHTHCDLTKLGEREIEYELEKSKGILEEITGKDVVTFSYPFSKFDERVPTALRKLRYKFAVGGRRGYVGREFDPFNLPRWGVGRNNSMLQFRLKMHGVYKLI